MAAMTLVVVALSVWFFDTSNFSSLAAINLWPRGPCCSAPRCFIANRTRSMLDFSSVKASRHGESGGRVK